MRSVSAIALLVTPRSAARAKSGRTAISERTRLAVDEMLPRPGMVRRSFSTANAAVVSACGSSPVSTSTYFSPEPPRPTLLRTPGSVSSAARILFSMPCLRGRSPRGDSKMVSVALRVSVLAPPMKGSVPAEPPPMVVYTLCTCSTWAMRWRASSATARVCASVAPGGSSRYTWVCELSSGGMKPVGSSGISASEPMKKAAVAMKVIHRCLMHHAAQRRYTVIQRGSLWSPTMGFRM